MQIDPDLQRAFGQGEIVLQGQFLLGSNYTFLVEVRHAGRLFLGVYKPIRGEQPLWDFEENTLALRETAAYLVSEVLGFDLVPYTVLRQEGPLGPGALQQYIEYDPEHHYFNFTEEERQLLKPVVLFDLLTNNADRKGSHIFFDADHKLWAIDHGLCFHVEDKLRTVIWDFAGQEIPDDLLSLLARTRACRGPLEPYLRPEEIAALERRAEELLAQRRFPFPPRHRRAVPYPLI